MFPVKVNMSSRSVRCEKSQLAEDASTRAFWSHARPAPVSTVHNCPVSGEAELCEPFSMLVPFCAVYGALLWLGALGGNEGL